MPAEENDAEVQAGGSEDPVKPAESAAANGMSDASAEKTAVVNEDPSAPSSAPKPVRRKRDEPVAEDFRSKLYWKEPTGWKWKFNPRIRNPIKGKDIDVLGRPWLDERKGHYTFNQDPKGPILRKPSPKFCVALIADHYPKGIKTQEEIADFKGQQVLDLCSVTVIEASRISDCGKYCAWQFADDVTKSKKLPYFVDNMIINPDDTQEYDVIEVLLGGRYTTNLDIAVKMRKYIEDYMGANPGKIPDDKFSSSSEDEKNKPKGIAAIVHKRRAKQRQENMSEAAGKEFQESQAKRKKEEEEAPVPPRTGGFNPPLVRTGRRTEIRKKDQIHPGTLTPREGDPSSDEEGPDEHKDGKTVDDENTETPPTSPTPSRPASRQSDDDDDVATEGEDPEKSEEMIKQLTASLFSPEKKKTRGKPRERNGSGETNNSSPPSTVKSFSAAYKDNEQGTPASMSDRHDDPVEEVFEKQHEHADQHMTVNERIENEERRKKDEENAALKTHLQNRVKELELQLRVCREEVCRVTEERDIVTAEKTAVDEAHSQCKKILADVKRDHKKEMKELKEKHKETVTTSCKKVKDQLRGEVEKSKAANDNEFQKAKAALNDEFKQRQATLSLEMSKIIEEKISLQDQVQQLQKKLEECSPPGYLGSGEGSTTDNMPDLYLMQPPVMTPDSGGGMEYLDADDGGNVVAPHPQLPNNGFQGQHVQQQFTSPGPSHQQQQTRAAISGTAEAGFGQSSAGGGTSTLPTPPGPPPGGSSTPLSTASQNQGAGLAQTARRSLVDPASTNDQASLEQLWESTVDDESVVSETSAQGVRQLLQRQNAPAYILTLAQALLDHVTSTGTNVIGKVVDKLTPCDTLTDGEQVPCPPPWDKVLPLIEVPDTIKFDKALAFVNPVGSDTIAAENPLVDDMKKLLFAVVDYKARAEARGGQIKWLKTVKKTVKGRGNSQSQEIYSDSMVHVLHWIVSTVFDENSMSILLTAHWDKTYVDPRTNQTVPFTEPKNHAEMLVESVALGHLRVHIKKMKNIMRLIHEVYLEIADRAAVRLNTWSIENTETEIAEYIRPRRFNHLKMIKARYGTDLGSFDKKNYIPPTPYNTIVKYAKECRKERDSANHDPFYNTGRPRKKPPVVPATPTSDSSSQPSTSTASGDAST